MIMWHIKIDYFNCENGISVLRSVKGADYDFNNLEESIRIKKIMKKWMMG